MDLREYLFRKRIKIIDFAEVIDVHRAYLSEIVNKKRRPSFKLAKKISMVTEGMVSITELLDIEADEKEN